MPRSLRIKLMRCEHETESGPNAPVLGEGVRRGAGLCFRAVRPLDGVAGMNRRTLRIFRSYSKSFNDYQKLQLARMVAEEAWTGPFTEQELDLSRELVDYHKPDRWFHGGTAGLEPGEVLKPAKETGLDPRGLLAAIPDRKSHVFITGDKAIAGRYAELANGQVYEVRPEGRVDVDPMELRTLQIFAADKEARLDDFAVLSRLPINNFCCSAATVLEVL